MVPGTESSAPAPPGGAPGSPAAAADAQGGLAGALAAALSQRKKKVSGSGKFPPFFPLSHLELQVLCATFSSFNCELMDAEIENVMLTY
jgi:hypothetical protein